MPSAIAAPVAPAAQAREKLLILDFGSQVTQLIARRLRELQVYCEIWPFDAAPARIGAFAPRGIILSGSHASVTEADAPRPHPFVFEAGIPVLGICYGQQVMTDMLGGRVESGHHREFGRAEVTVARDSPLMAGWGPTGTVEPVWMSHGDRVTQLAPGFQPIAASPGAPFAVIADEARHLYGVQFHPEVVHTPHGTALLRAFARQVCGIADHWSMAGYRDQAIRQIRAQVGSEHVICGLSGGVDSAVTAVLIHEAIGDQLTCIFVDTGLLRSGEAAEVVTLFREHYNIPLVHVDAGARFLTALEGQSDPEVKRKTIGRVFIDVFEDEAKRLGGAGFLAQGTLYPDVIESVSVVGKAATIKSHHNVGGLPERLGFKLLEPLRALFKDEVRALGRELGLPEGFIGRHPFPGPGLAIRCPGTVTPEALTILRQADAIFLEELRSSGLYDQVWQAFAVFLPVRAVGVMGDGRTYDYAVGLRAVTSTDGMTAEAAALPHDFLARTATRIVNEVRGVNRVLYDVTSKPPGTIEWE